jgi:hypothetical protein
MSQINPPAGGLTTTQAADAFVRQLSTEAKRAVLLSLLRDGVRVDDTSTPPDAPAADWRTMKVVPPVLSPEEIAELRALDPDDCFDPMELEEELRRTGQD